MHCHCFIVQFFITFARFISESSNYINMKKFLSFSLTIVLAFALNAAFAQCPAPSGVTAQWTAPTTVSVSWTENGTATQWQVEYGVLGSTTGNYITTTSNPVTIYNLDSISNYQFKVRSSCGATLSSWSAKASLCTLNNCIDYADFGSSNVWGYWGDFDNPYEHTGFIYFPSGSPNAAQARHTWHTDPNETDPRTNNQLHTVYPGACKSIRLGNWQTGAEAEAIKYRLVVDTTKFGILLLNYAAVMQDPNHTPAEQPRFKIEILNVQNQPLDPCGQRDFIANANLGWNSCSNNVLWKDWTTVGLDISQYHGQSIFIRLTTYDCDQSGHYGYAYFTLACAQKSIKIAGCGTGTKTMTAPNGFNYQWYSSAAPNVILSTSQSYTVVTDGSSYTCKCISTENANCYFTLEAVAEPRYPKSAFDYTYQIHDGCSYEVSFNNTSYVSSSFTDSVPTNDPNDSYEWTFSHYGDPDTTTVQQSPTLVMAPGLHHVRLVSNLAECSDTITRTIILPMLYADTAYIYDSICVGTPYNLHGFNLDETQTVGGIVYDTIHTASAHGCDSTSVLALRILHAPAPQHLYGEVTMTLADDTHNGLYIFQIDPVPGVSMVSGEDGYEWILHDASWYMYPNPILQCTLVVASPNQNAYLEVIAHSQCGAGSLMTRLTASEVGINEIVSSSISVKPNPTTGNINIHSSMDLGKVNVTVFNASFNAIDEFESFIDANSDLNYSFGNMSDGVYFICIESEQNRIFKKVVLMK